MSVEGNKRIAKNTFYLYIRMGISLVVSLYTSRVILQALGVTDMGIYNVVGGISSMFGWLSSSLSNSTQRYLNFSLGQSNLSETKRVFNQSIVIFLIYALISLLVVEIGGLWLIENKLEIPESRKDAAIWVLNSTTITVCVTIIASVYESVLIARENMKIYAYIGLVDTFMKLGLVYVLLLVTVDRLKVYAVLMACLIILSKLIPIIYCTRRYSECKLMKIWDKGLFNEMMKFSGWNVLGIGIFILNNQGLDILLNVFFGPAVNAARAIANQVKNALSNFTSGFFTAIRPQIIKSFASGNSDEMMTLLYRGTKFLVFLLWLMSIPIMVNIDWILGKWLTVVPEYTAPLIIWSLIFCLINLMCDPISTAIQATGKQKLFILGGGAVYVMAFPISFTLLKCGMNPVSPFIVLAGVRLIYWIVILKILQKYVNYSLKSYFRKAILPIIVVIAVSSILVLIRINIFERESLNGILSALYCFIITSLTIFFIGLSSNEKSFILNKIKSYVHKKNN